MLSPVKIWRNQKKIAKILGMTGRILSWTSVFVPPAGFEYQAPYVIALVQLENKYNYTAQLVDWESEDLHFGRKVKAILRKTRDNGMEGIIPYGIKFKPI